MIGLLEVLTAATLVCDAPAAPPVLTAADSTYPQLFAQGVTFTDFLAKAERRKEQWEKNFRDAVVPDALLARARGVPGSWKFLVVAVDGCTDSVNTVPYLAKLVNQLMGVEMRIIGSDAGRAIMDSHKTPDGRGATPTILLLDANFQERGCFIERPAVLVDLMNGQKGKVADDKVFEGKMEWYDKDKGQHTLEDLVSVMEKAGRGEKAC